MDRIFPQSLCHHCKGIQYTQSKSGSLFLMCKRTDRRYAPQPLTVCTAFEPTYSIQVQVQIDEALYPLNDPNEFQFKFHLQTDLVIPQHDILDHQPVYSCWQRVEPINAKQVFFQRTEQQESTFDFDFEKGHKLPSPILSPSFSFVIHRSNLIEWSDKPKRYSTLGWFSTLPYQAADYPLPQLIKQAKFITFKVYMT